VTYLFLASRLYPFGLSGEVKTDDKGQLVKSDDQQIMSLDVTTRFTNDWSGEVTRYPVSQGSEITDHITIRNSKFTLEGMISDMPFEKHPAEFFGSYGTGSYRAMAAVETFQQMFEEKVVFTLFSEYQQIDNCVITSVNFEQSGEYAVHFAIGIEQLRFAYAKTVTLNVSSATKKKTGSNKNGGGTTKVQMDPTSYQQNRDAAQKAADRTG